MRGTNALVAIVVALSGCVTQKATYLPDGRQGYTITCNGTMMDWAGCYEKAGKICEAKGYEILTKNEGDAVTASQYAVVGGTYSRSMMIACK